MISVLIPIPWRVSIHWEFADTNAISDWNTLVNPFVFFHAIPLGVFVTMIRVTKKRLSGFGLLLIMGCGGSELPTAPPIPPDFKQVTPPAAGVVPRPKGARVAPSENNAN